VRQQCEWCIAPAKWRFRVGDDYVRLSCSAHINKTRRLIRLDLGAVLYHFAAIDTEGSPLMGESAIRPDGGGAA
jgi:hypothetical protein